MKVIILAGIIEILIISTLRDPLVFQDLLGDGKSLGILTRFKMRSVI